MLALRGTGCWLPLRASTPLRMTWKLSLPGELSTATLSGAQSQPTVAMWECWLPTSLSAMSWFLAIVRASLHVVSLHQPRNSTLTGCICRAHGHIGLSLLLTSACLEQKRIEQCVTHGDHTGSLSRRQPGAETLG